MTTAIDKAKVSGITAVLGAIVAIVYGFANYALLASFGTFITMMLIQYSSLKIKIAITAAAALSLLASIQYSRGFP